MIIPAGIMPGGMEPMPGMPEGYPGGGEPAGLNLSQYDNHSGLANLYTDPGDDMDLVVDITDLLKNDGLIMVTALAAKGTYDDQHGQVVDLHEPLEETDTRIFKLVLAPDNKTVDVLHPHLSLRSTDDDSHNAWDQGADSPWVRTLKRLKTSLGDDSIVVDGMELIAMGFFVAPQVGQQIEMSGSYHLTRVKSFKENFDVSLTFISEYGQMSVTFSVIRPPSMPMAPRVFDDRLAFFTQDYVDMGVHTKDQKGEFIDPRKALDPKVSVIWRYDLSRLPDQQIKIYVDPSVPKRWQKAFKDGIEAWNDAFLGAGFSRNTIRGVLPSDADWPKDYDAGDARFNTISWAVDLDEVFSVGIAKVDPRSGEILKSDIVMGAGWVRAWLDDYQTYYLTERQHTATGFHQESLTVVNENEESPSDQDETKASMLQADATTDKKASVHTESPRKTARKTGTETEYEALHFLDHCPLSLLAMGVDEASWFSVAAAGLKSVVMHETGHILGLRHNFKGSMGVSYECTQDKACSAEEGLTASIMDYIPINIPSTGIENVHLFSPVVGKFDKLAIRYGYMELHKASKEVHNGLPVAPKELLRVLDEANSYLNCLDEDVQLGQDPTCVSYDFTGDPLRYYEDQIQLVRKMQAKMLEISVGPGESYMQYGDKVWKLLVKVFGIQESLMSWVGGMNYTRVHRPLKVDTIQTPFAKVKPSIATIPVKDQRKALKMLVELARPSKQGLLPSGDLVANLAYNRQESIGSMNLKVNIRNQQDRVISFLLSSTRLSHIILSMEYGGMPISVFFDDVTHYLLGSKDGKDLLVSTPEDWDLQSSMAHSLVRLREEENSVSSVEPHVVLAIQKSLNTIEGGLTQLKNGGTVVEWADCVSPGTNLCRCSGEIRLKKEKGWSKSITSEDGVVECKAETFDMLTEDIPMKATCQCLPGAGANEPLRMHLLRMKSLLKKSTKDAGLDSGSYRSTSACWLLVVFLSQITWLVRN